METKGKPYQRAPQVLALLATHGQLSAKTLQILLEPQINVRRLNEVLQRHCEQGLICKQYDRLFGNSGVFYYLNQNTQSILLTAQKLKTQPQLISPPFIRHAELIHSQHCTLWTEKLKHFYTDDLVLREQQFYKNDIYDQHFPKWNPHDQVENRPDIFMELKVDRSHDKSIAFEIEQHQKSEKRLVEKLKNYTTKTYISGLVYACSKDAIQHRLRHIYLSKILDRAMRINYYGQNFMVFAPLDQDYQNLIPLWFQFRVGYLNSVNGSVFYVNLQTLKGESLLTNIPLRTAGSFCI